jgi:hypothetical protein
MKVGLYSISYLGIWYDGPALTWREFLQQAQALGYDGVEFDRRRPHACPMPLDAPARRAIDNAAGKPGFETAALSSNNDLRIPVPECRQAPRFVLREKPQLAPLPSAGERTHDAQDRTHTFHSGHAPVPTQPAHKGPMPEASAPQLFRPTWRWSRLRPRWQSSPCAASSPEPSCRQGGGYRI